MKARAKASIAVALGLLVALLVAPASASAGEAHLFKETFGSVAQPSFARSQALAIDQSTGDLLVADETTGTLSRFKPNGEPDPFSALGSNVIDGKGGADKTPPPQEGLKFVDPRLDQIAIDESAGPGKGNIYVTQYLDKLVDVFSPTGAYLGQLSEFKEGLSAEGALKPFGEICGVAVDSSGAVYVGDFKNGEVHKFNPTGTPAVNADSKANFPVAHVCMLAAGVGPTAGALFAGELNVLGGSGHILKLDAGSGGLKYPVSSLEYRTIAVDPGSGHLYGAQIGGPARVFDASGASEATLIDSFAGEQQVVGVAVKGSTGDVYVSRSSANPHIEVWETVFLPEAITKAAGGLTTGSATLNGTVNPEGSPLKPNPTEGCFFEWGTTTSYGHTAPCEAPNSSEVGSGKAPVAVHAAISGLKAGSTYHFRLVAANAAAPVKGKDEALVTLGPSVGEEEAKDITTTTATIAGTVNPRGESTGYLVEYVSEAEFQKSGYNSAAKAPASPVAIGSENAFLPVSQQLTELSPGTTYHYRLVATNPVATVQGADRIFATFAVPPAGLPDERAWEMVSPAVKLGEVFAPEPKNFLGGSCAECLPGGNDLTMPMQARPDGNAVAYEGQAFVPGLATGANQYLGERSAGGWSTEGLSGQDFASGRGDGQSGYKAFSADLSKAVLAQSAPALSPQAPVAPDGTAYSNLYLRSEGELTPLVTTEPPNRPPGKGGGAFLPVFSGANSGSASVPAFSHLVFEANDSLTEEVPGIAPAAPAVGPSECKAVTAECDLYEWVGGELRLVNVLPGNAVATPGAAIGSGRQLAEGSGYQAPNVDRAISADGSRIFWSDASGQLYVRIDGAETLEVEDPGTYLVASTDGSRVLLNDGCLYSLETEECEAELGTPATFQGILGSSEDLSRVYFVDTSVQTGAEENANGEAAQAGKLNLYAWSKGTTEFIGRLLTADNANGLNSSLGTWKASPQNRTAQVSSDGGFLAFMSQAPLTGYDNEVEGGTECGKGRPATCFETYEYSAATGQLICASCNPTGSKPLRRSNLSLIAAAAPFPQPHNLPDSGEGRLFFESQDVLSASDTNGQIQDVYEWEPQGVGSCEKQGGCVFLVSSGHSPNDSMFLDATPSGDDAFFVTREQLVPQDKDDQLDLYDARVGGGIEVVGEAPCEGEACKGPGTEAPSQLGAGSAEFVGPGNEKSNKCPPGKVRRRGKCTKPNAHKHKHRRRAAKHNRGGRR
jgi:hypothetical protein